MTDGAIHMDLNKSTITDHWKGNLYVCVFGSFINMVAITLLVPFLPMYVEQLGVVGHAAIVQWSGLVFGATFLSAAIVAPLWGRLADRYGYKVNLVRASFGMTVTTFLVGLTTNVWQLFAVRLLLGLAGGYTAGSYALVAAQAPEKRSSWALGVLTASITAGSLTGPLIGGVLPSLIGMRGTFFLASACIFLNFLATILFVKEKKRVKKTVAAKPVPSALWSQVRDWPLVISLLVTVCALMVANTSIEPILTVYVQELLPQTRDVTLISGVVMAGTALGSTLSASYLGKLADRLGRIEAVIACLLVSALLLIPQAFVTSVWQLLALRFLMGLSLGGLLPSVISLIRHNVQETAVGRILGYSTSVQYGGQVIGPVLGGFAGGHFGMRSVFIATSILLFVCATFNWVRFRDYLRQGNLGAGGSEK